MAIKPPALINLFRSTAISFSNVTEEPHFEKTSFRVKKKIFATLNEKANRGCVKLTSADQDLFCLHDKSAVYPVPNKWGLQGWTNVDLKKVKPEVLKDLLETAYRTVTVK